MIIEGDCIEVMRGMESNSVDTVITDPPYHLTSITKRFGKKGAAPAKYGTDGAFQRASKGFMGKEWDGGDIAFKTDVWEECLRVAKPGATLLCFGGSRTYHRMACAIEDAGWVIKDCIMWIYGSGFPKALDISKQIEKRAILTDEDKQWIGWKSHGLKPAYEPIIVAMKPNDRTYVDNALKWGVSGFNIDECRIGTTGARNNGNKPAEDGYTKGQVYGKYKPTEKVDYGKGRFPANVIFECTCDETISGSISTPYTYKDSRYNVEGFIPEIRPNAPSNYNDKTGGIIHTDPECPCYMLDEQSGITKTNADQNYIWDNTTCSGNTFTGRGKYTPRSDQGGASRFFKQVHIDPDCPCRILDEQSGYECGQLAPTTGKEPSASKVNAIYNDYSMVEGKASKPKDGLGGASRFFYCAKASKSERNAGVEGGCSHPTVKPLKLMEYLCKLTKTPTGGIVLDPFAGSCTTACACILTGRDYIMIEKDKDYYEIGKARIKYYENERKHRRL